MNEEELFFLVSVTVVMPILVLWIIFSYQKARLKIKQSQPDNSLTTSELNTLIDDAVAEATEPMGQRIDELEQQIRLLNPAQTPIQDEPGDVPEEAHVRAKTLGRTRT